MTSVADKPEFAPICRMVLITETGRRNDAMRRSPAFGVFAMLLLGLGLGRLGGKVGSHQRLVSLYHRLRSVPDFAAFRHKFGLALLSNVRAGILRRFVPSLPKQPFVDRLLERRLRLVYLFKYGCHRVLTESEPHAIVSRQVFHK